MNLRREFFIFFSFLFLRSNKLLKLFHQDFFKINNLFGVTYFEIDSIHSYKKGVLIKYYYLTYKHFFIQYSISNNT